MAKLTADSIRTLTDDGSFIRGKGYLSEDRVYDAVLHDGVLRGMCTGSMNFDYEMEVRLGPDGVTASVCTCPQPGFCKHLVALSLLFIERLEEVVEFDTERVTAILQNQKKDDLISMLVDHAHNDLPLAREILAEEDPARGQQRTPSSDLPFATLVARYRALADKVCPSSYRNPYRAALEYASELQRLLMREMRTVRNDTGRLLAFYTGVYESLEEHIGQMDDSDGSLGGVAQECAQGMADAVCREDLDAATLCDWVRITLPLYLENEYGIGDSLREPLRAVSDPRAVELAERLLREFLDDCRAGAGERRPDEDEPYSHSRSDGEFRITIMCEMLGEFYRRAGRESEIDSLYRENGLHFHYTMHRLAMDDADGAVSHAREHLRNGYDVQRFGQGLLDSGEYERAHEFLDYLVPLLEVKIPYRGEILAISAQAAERVGDSERALAIRFQAFREGPTVETFRSTYLAAQALGVEEEYDRKMVEAFPADSHGGRRLVEIHIHRRDIDAALAAFNADSWFGDDELALRLAAAARKSRPDASRQLIMNVVETNIERRNRTHYERAASAVGRLRDLMNNVEFDDYLADLRERYKRLPALRDELNREFGE